MNEDIEKLKEKLKKILENYEIDKKIGQLSVDSIYHIFPTESKILLDYIEQLQNNWNELKKWLEECLNELKQNDVYDRTSYEQGEIIALESSIAKVQELEQVKDE